MILDFLYKTFNNREIALISYMLIFIFWGLTQTKIRKSIGDVIQAFFAWKILVSILALLLYVSIILYCLKLIDLWDKSLLKDSIYWTFGVGLIMMMNFDKALKEKRYFTNMVRENLKLIVILEFILGLYVFGIITEFILMPFVIAFSILLGYTEVYSEHHKIHRIATTFFSLLGIIYLAYSVYRIYIDSSGFANSENLKAFLFPILMTFLFLPFIYTYILIVQYEMLFVRVGLSLNENRKLRRYAEWKILISINLSISKLRRFSPGFLFGGCSTKYDIRKEIRNRLKSNI